jgi:DNA polymerase-3 subunit epsilon
MILGYDSETTGLPAFSDPSDAPHQPHLIQLAMILQDMDGNEVDRFVSIVRPGAGAVMSPEAFDAHGITLERAMDEGCDPVLALDAFLSFAGRALLMAGHNESFDRRIMRILSARHRAVKWEPTCPSFCTMWKSKFIINLPPTQRMIAAGMPGPKAPKLGEAYLHFFGKPLEGAHDALVDVEASLAVMWHLIRECGVPMFKAARSASAARTRRPSAARASGGDPFAAAAALLGGGQ